MKRLLSFTLIFLFCLIFINAKKIKSTKQESIGKISFILGDVFIQKKGVKTLTKAQINAALYPEIYIITKKKSSATVMFTTGSLLQLNENSTIFLNDYVFDKKAESISVCFGKIKMKVKKLEKDERMQIYTPTAVAGVRGTEFEVGVASDGSSKVIVQDGAVNFDQAGNSVTLATNETADVPLNPTKAQIEKKATTPTELDTWMQGKDDAVKQNPVEGMKNLEAQQNNVQKDSENLDSEVKQQSKSTNVETIKGLADDFQQNIAGNTAIKVLANNINTQYSAKDRLVRSYNQRIEMINRAVANLQERINKAFDEIEKRYQEKVKDIEDKYKKATEKFEKK